MRVLYVLSVQAEDTSSPMDELAALEPALEVHTAAGAAAALVEIRAGGGYRAVFLSPQLPHNESLALVATLRRDRAPVAIVAIINESQRQFFAPAITAGADDVLVLRETGLITAQETLRRVRHSRHLERPEGQMLLRVLYVGQDDVVWDLLSDMPFVKADHGTAAVDGSCPLSVADGSARADVIIVDEQPGDGHALQVVKWLKAHAPEIPLVALTSPTGHDVGGAALELGADDVVSKAGTDRRRLVATLHRHYLRLASSAGSRPAIFVEPVETAERAESALAAETRIRELTAEVNALGATLDAQRQRYDELQAAQGAEAAARDREELAQLRQGLAEERERRIILEGTLRQTEDRVTADAEALEAHHADVRRSLEEQLATAADRLHEVANETQALQTRLQNERTAEVNALGAALDAQRRSYEKLQEAQGLEAAARDGDREEVTQLRQGLAEERERRIVLEGTLRQTEDRVAADAEALEAHHADVRRSLEEQLATAADRLHEAANALDAQRRSYEKLQEAQGLEAAARDLDREELVQLRQGLAEERERRIVLEGTLRQTEDRVTADAEALEAHHAAVRRSLEEQLATAADRLHQVANALDAQRQSYEKLQEAQGLEAAARDRDREELAQLRQGLAEEHERRIVLEGTLRQTEDRVTADTEALEAHHAAVRRSLEEQLATATIQSDLFGWATVTLEGALIRCNTAFARMFGFDSPADALAGSGSSFPGLADHAHVVQQLQAGADVERVESVFHRADGHPFRVLTSAAFRPSSDDHPTTIDRVLVDIDERAHIELTAEVRALGAKLDAQRQSYDELREAQGFERAMRDRDHEELARLRHALAEEREHRIVLEGTLRQTEDRVTADTEVLEARHAAVRRSLEEQLATATERLHQVANETQALQNHRQNELTAQTAERDRLVQSHLFGWATVTLEGALVRCNAAFARMFGFDSPADALAGSGSAFPGLADHAHVVQQLQAGANVDRVQSVLHRADGHPFHVLTSAAFRPSGDDHPPTIDRVLVDIDERTHIEEQLRLSRRLEAAGRLAAEMSPEIEPTLSSLEDPEGASSDPRRAAMLVRQLLAFSRHQAKPAGWLSLYDAVRRAEPQLRRIAGDVAHVELRLQDVGAIAASEDDIEQLLAALTFAAAGSLPYGGTITLDTRSVRTGFDQRTELAVGASGYGVHSALISTSLARLVAKCGGTVRVTDDPARVTTLHVHLPC